MTKVVIRIDPYYQDRFEPWRSVSKTVSDSGFDMHFFPQGTEVGDINVVHLQLLQEQPDLLERCIDSNLIVYERNGCAPVTKSSGARQLLADRRVKRWLKDIVFRDPSLYNAPMVGNRLHMTYLPLKNGTIQPATSGSPISEESICKIASFLPIYMYPRMDPFLNHKLVPVSKRKVDCFFAGNMKFEQEQVEQHRILACQAMIGSGRRSVVYAGKMLKGDSYVEMLKQPKIIVSPYGSGGYSWKDFEALYMGAVLVKPDNEFSKTYGFDIFEGQQHLVKCKPDFSDLGDVFSGILDSIQQYDAIVEERRDAIMRARDHERLAKDLVQMFTSSLT